MAMSKLMIVCTAIQDKYGERYAKVTESLNRLPVKNSPFAQELQAMRSLYAAIVNASIDAMPELERAAAAERLGHVVDREVAVSGEMAEGR